MHDITGSTVSIKAAAPANMSFRQGSYRPSTLLAAWWALLQFAGTQAAVTVTCSSWHFCTLHSRNEAEFASNKYRKYPI
jgi:hypothetical protein